MILKSENYFSQQSNREYLSVSQYKDFCGTLGKLPCEELALAKLNGVGGGNDNSTAGRLLRGCTF